jgi:hypothetical protein
MKPHYEVRYLTVHHGQEAPERPWCVCFVSPAGTPGEPRDGVRIYTSHGDRDIAIMEVARRQARMDPRYRRLELRLEKRLFELEKEWAARVDADLEARGNR